MKAIHLNLNSGTRLFGALALSYLIGGSPAFATQTIRELFDSLGAGGSLNGKGSNPTTFGLRSDQNWTNHPPGSTAITYKDSFTVDWPFGNLEYGGIFLSSSGGAAGCLNVGPGNLESLIDPNTSLAYGTFSSYSYATRALSNSAYIDFRADGTYYFTYRIVKSYPWSIGDNSVGVAFASGSGTNAHFVGAGFTRPTPFIAEDGITDIGDTVFISTGTLGQPGVPGHPDDSGGPYYPRAAGLANLITGDTRAGLLVGRLTTTASGNSTLEAKVYLPSSPLDQDPETIVWDVSYQFVETNVMTHLVMFMHGTGGHDYDAIRVGTSYGDVIGLELIGIPSGSPGNTVYAGTTVTLSQKAALNTGPFPMSFQWRSNGVDILDATAPTLVLTNPTPSFTADYSVVVSNYYGVLTSGVQRVTVNPAVPPLFTAQPGAVTRYLGAPTATFSVGVDGTPPFSFQWKHAGTNIPGATEQSLTVGPIALADAGQYSVNVTNIFGSTNSAVATLTVLTPPPATYAAAVTALSPHGYWHLDDEMNSVIYDAWGGNHGTAVDPANIQFGVAGAPYAGFPADHKAIRVVNGAAASRLNLPTPPVFSNTMSFAIWVSGDCTFMSRNAYGNAYGLERNDGGLLQFDWAGGIAFNSGLTVPPDVWTFVALVVEPFRATIYMGADRSPLVSVAAEGLAIAGSDEWGDQPLLSPLALGRNPWPWADDGVGQGWATLNSAMSDMAIFYSSLTPEEVEALYLAGIGFAIDAEPDGAGNLILNWTPGATLQQADSVNGPYTDIMEASPPYYVPILPTGDKFYRLKR